MEGLRAKKRRKELKLSAQDIADTLGTSRVTVSRWEAGISEPDDKTKLALAKVLGTSVAYLMGETDNAGAPEDKTPDEKNNLPINNTSGVSEDDLDLGYWGAMAERAARVAQSENEGKKKIISAILKQAAEAVTGAGSEGGKNEVNQVIYGGKENKNEFNA